MTYFCDRNFGRLLPIAMSLLDLDVEIHDAHFAQSALDDEWLPEVGKRGWVVLTQDPRFLSNASEKAALIQYSIACFVFATDGLKRWEKLRVIAKVWDIVEEIVRTETAPYVYRVSRTGQIRRLHPPP